MSEEPKGHILVLEPNDVTRKLIMGILARGGYATHEARNGDEAVSLLLKKPHLVILNVEGDSADNQGFIKKMQKDHGKMPLIALLESADREEVQQRLSMPRVSFL